MTANIADSLVLVFTFGMSLRGWRDTGMLDREWALYDALLPHYKRLVIVSYGDDAEVEILDSVLGSHKGTGRVRLVHNRGGDDLHRYAARLPGLVLSELDGCASVLVKTNQMVGGEVAVNLADELRSRGKSVALLARGGYLWTRFVSYERGPHSKAAEEAAATERRLCTSADMTVGSTEDMVKDLAWRYGLDPAKTMVVPNYVLPADSVIPADQRERGLLVYAGQLVRRKRVDVLIDAVAQLPPEIRAIANLEIYGDGPERKSLVAQAAALNAPVKFQSRVGHHVLLERMRHACAFVQASELEGHPKTVLEAMACGTPVIVADTPGLSEVVAHGATGLKVPIDPDAFATAIAEMINDSDWLDILGSAAARATRSHFGLQTVLPLEILAHTRALTHATARRAAA